MAAEKEICRTRSARIVVLHAERSTESDAIWSRARGVAVRRFPAIVFGFGKIYFWDHESDDEPAHVAESFSDFVAQLEEQEQ
jgi:hypothetical protein